MKTRTLNHMMLDSFEKQLISEEKSDMTVEKYLRDIRCFYEYAGHREITKELVVEYKNRLTGMEYAVSSINSMLASLNSFFRFLGWTECHVRSLKTQRKIYCAENRELTKDEYMRLLAASKNQPRLNLILQTIGSTGIRVSELEYFTVDAVQKGEVTVSAKGKNRTILLPGKLKKLLMRYASKMGIKEGVIFRTRSGKSINRSNIWSEMKRLCRAAGVEPGKVFPHNLRKLFARTFYSIEKDIAKLADLLGHSSINTTRIYIISSGLEHRRIIERLGLLS